MVYRGGDRRGLRPREEHRGEARRGRLGRADGAVLDHRRTRGLDRDERGRPLRLRGRRGGRLRARRRSNRDALRGGRPPGPRRLQGGNGGLVRQVPHRLRDRGQGVGRVRRYGRALRIGRLGRIRLPGRRRRLHRVAALGDAEEGGEAGRAVALSRGRGGGEMRQEPRVAGAPISWGVIEIPDWGYQMPADRLLHEAASVGLKAMETGPEDFLPLDPAEVRDLLSSHGLGLVGGFVLVERRAEFFVEAGADTLVLAAIPSTGAFEEPVDLDEAAWKELFENLRRVEEICARHGLATVLHPHFGTVVETDEQLRRFLEGCDTGLCLDTGHLVIGGSDPLEVAEKAADRVKHVHLKDVDREVAGRLGAREIGFKEACLQGAFRPLGEGDVDVARLLEILAWSEYRGWYVLEQDIVVETEPPEGEGPVGDIRESMRFLQAVLGGSDGDDS